MILYFSPHITENTTELLEDEFKHCCKVLRQVVGDRINITNGKGTRALAEIQSIGKHSAQLSILSTESIPAPENAISIAIAPPKNRSRWEWFLEKAVEIGVDHIIPLKTFHSEKTNLNVARSNKIIRSAALQSLRSHHPSIEGQIELNKFLNQDVFHSFDRYIAHYKQEYSPLWKMKSSHQKSILLIGPEGDFSEEELQLCMNKGFQAIKLSEYRLRTETAGIVALTYLMQL